MNQKTSFSFFTATLAFRSLRHFVCLLPALALAMVGSAYAQTPATSTGATGLNLSSGSSWTSGTGTGGIPGTNQIALFNTTGTQSDTLGASMTWGELELGSTSGALTIAGDASLFTLTLNGVNSTTLGNGNANTFGLIGIDMSGATNNLTFGGANDALTIGAAQSWLVKSGRTLTISGALSGSGNITIGSGSSSAGGTVILQTTADTFAPATVVTGAVGSNVSGNYIVNNTTLNIQVGQSSTASFVLNNGATLSGDQALTSTNYIYMNSGLATVSMQGGSNTLSALFAGNGDLVWAETTVNNDTYTPATPIINIFGNYGGTVEWGTSGSEIRIQGSTGTGGNVSDPFTNFDLGSSTGSVSFKESAWEVFGGLQSTGNGSIGGGTTGHSGNYIVGSANLTQTFAGTILNSAASGNEFTKVGTGTLTLTGSDTAATSYNASTTDSFAQDVDGGTLQLSFSTNTSNIMATAGTMEIQSGGTFALLGNSGASTASAQTVNGLTVKAGGGAIVINPNGGLSTTLNLGAITATAAGATLDITEKSGTASVTTTTANNAEGLISAGTVVFTNSSGTVSFATETGSTPFTISGYSGATSYTGGAGSATTNYSVVDSQAIASGAAFYTLQILTPSTNTLSFGGAFTVAGGILYTGSAAETLSGGTSASNLIIQDYGTGALTYANAITGTATITVAGSSGSDVILTGGAANTTTGTVYINLGGTISVAAANDLGAGTTLDLMGGTLQATATPITISRSVVIGGGGGTVDVQSGDTLTLSGVVSDAGVTNASSAFGPLIKTDSGTLVLSNTNTYSGATIIDDGILSVSTLALGNTSSGIGNAPSTANALIIGANTTTANVLGVGTLQYTGAAVTTDRTFTIGADGGALDASGSGALVFSNTSPVWYTTSGSRTLTLTGTNTGANTLAAAITDPGFVNPGGDPDVNGGAAFTGSTSLAKTGAGEWVLTGANSYSGGTTVSGGTLQLGTGDASALGASTGALAVNSGTLDLNGNSVAAGTFSGTGSGAIVTDSASSTSPVLTVNSSTASTFAGAIQNGSGTVALSVAGTGALTLTGANTYTGATTVGVGGSAGTLALGTGGALSNTAISVGNGATLLTQTATIGSSSASLTLAAGSTFSMVGDNAAGTLTLNGSSTPLTIGTTGSIGIASLDFEVSNGGGYSVGSDLLAVSGGAVSFLGTGGVGGKIFISGLGTIAPTNGEQFTLITDSSGGLNTTGLVLGTTAIILDGNSYTLALTTPSNTSAVVTFNLAALNYYWTGNTSASWSTLANFATDATGATPQSTPLSSTSNVFLTETTVTTPGNITPQTLDGSYTINSLIFTGSGTSAGSTAINLEPGSGGALTINAGNSFVIGSNTYSGTGVLVQSGSAAQTISANVVLGGSQTWEIDSSNALTMSGIISDNSLGYGLTKVGSGELFLSGANTYGGVTTVSAGTLALGAAGSVPGSLTVNGTGTFDLAGFNQTVSNLADGGVNTGILTSSSGTPILTVNNSTPDTFSGNITGSLGLSMTGSNTLLLSGTGNTYSGATSVSAGTLKSGATNALPIGTTLTLAGTATFDLAGHNQTLGGLSDAGVGTDFLANSTGTSNLTINAALSSTFSGTMSGNINLNLTGSSTLTLGGTNTFSGTTVLGGTSTLQVGNALALQNSTLNYNNQGGTLTFGVTSATLGALQGGQSLALTSVSSAGVALTVGGTNASTTYSGALSGTGGSLTKVGNGTLTLSGSNSYTGSTTDSVGTLVINSTGVINGAAVNIFDNAGGIIVNGGSLTGTTSGLGNGSGLTVENGGSATFSGAIASDSANGVNIVVTGGTLTAAGISNSRTSSIFTTQAEAETGGGSGFLVSGGTVTDTGGLGIGSLGGANSSSYAAITGGSVNVSGVTTITNSNGGRYSILTLSSTGTFTSTNTGTGVVIGGVFGNADSEFYITGGTANINTITFGDGTQTAGTDVLHMTGGKLYLGTSGGTGGGIALGGAGAFVNTITLGGGTLGAQGNWSSALNMTLGGTTIQTANSSGTAENISLSGILSGTTLTETGTGILTLTGANQYTGGTAVSGGATVNINGINALGGANYNGLTLNSSTLQYATGITGANGSTDLTSIGSAGIALSGTDTIDTNGNAVVYLNSIGNSGTGALTVQDTAGTGSLTLDGVNTYTGVTTINSGATLQLGDGTTGHDGTIATSASITDNGTLIYDRNGALSSSLVISGSGSVTVAGTGSQTLTGANTYSGLTTINSGATLQLGDGTSGHDGTIGSSAGVIDNGTLVYNRNGAQSSSYTISGFGGVSVLGTGSQTLTGANTYSGGTTVTGTLLVNNASGSATGSGVVTVNSGGALGVTGNVAGGTGTISTSGITAPGANAVTIAAGATLSPSGGSGGLSTLNLTLASGVSPTPTTVNLQSTNLVFDLGASGASDVVAISNGTLTLNGQNLSSFTFIQASGFTGSGTYNLFTTDGLNGDTISGLDSNPADLTGTISVSGTGYTGTLSIVGGDNLQLSVSSSVPEPSSWALMMGGFALLLVLQARRRRS